MSSMSEIDPRGAEEEAGPDAALAARLGQFPARRIAIREAGLIGWRESGPAEGAGDSTARAAAGERALPVVLLHGIGSGAASWLAQLDTLGASRRVLAWDAPGYGESTPVAPASPLAADYAASLAGWLDALAIERCVLVGHSLGAIVAGAFARRHAGRLAGLLLVSPAAGYGAAPAATRDERRDARLAMLAALGPAGLAEQRSANMLSAHAGEAARAWVRRVMAQVKPAGYTQATHLLANADLAADLAAWRAMTDAAGAARVEVMVGAEDGITPPNACERIAAAAGVALRIVPRAGHAGYVEAPERYSALIGAFCARCDESWRQA